MIMKANSAIGGYGNDYSELIGFLLIFFFVAIVVMLVTRLLTVIAKSFTLRKAGHAYWGAAFVPIWGDWCMAETTMSGSEMRILVIVSSILEVVATFFAPYAADESPVYLLALCIVPFAKECLLAYSAARSFGHSAWFAAGLVILPFIFWPILGFGNAPYLGYGVATGKRGPDFPRSIRYGSYDPSNRPPQMQPGLSEWGTVPPAGSAPWQGGYAGMPQQPSEPQFPTGEHGGAGYRAYDGTGTAFGAETADMHDPYSPDAHGEGQPADAVEGTDDDVNHRNQGLDDWGGWR